MDARAVPSVDDVRRIAMIANPVLRNLEITDCYSRLAVAFATRSGEGANWCTFATWASRQAGRTIRGEDPLDHLGRTLRERRWVLHPIATLWRSLLRRGLFQRETLIGRLTAELHTPFDAFERASDSVARGNTKVFEEIGFEFARYLEECPPDASVESPEFEHFIDRLRPGEPPEGQRYLRQAFARYARFPFARDPKARAELAVLANLEIGLHEQTRLQPEIHEALDAAYATHQDLGRRALEALAPSAARWWPAVRRPAAAVVGVFAAGAQRAASRLAREGITESLMTLSLPERVLALGTHLADEYPELLREPVDAELIELLDRFEPVPPARDDCGARDWSDFHQRMHYIVHLFRAFHLDDELLRPPFTAGQVASFSRSVVPGGRL
ncbi:MAG TPA: hypothetical protein VJ645_07975 [Gaiellaceae bacterium]|nr:hypothetical protein [Gaiellaceae bacterium]